MNCLVAMNDEWEFSYNLQPCPSLEMADTILLFYKKSLCKSNKVSLLFIPRPLYNILRGISTVIYVVNTSEYNRKSRQT